MSIYNLAALCLVYALAVATPGPGIAAIVARCVSGGSAWGVVGLCMGTSFASSRARVNPVAAGVQMRGRVNAPCPMPRASCAMPRTP